MRAVLKKPALLSIICATVETFKKESFLILLGHRRRNDFVIENAVPLQTAKRKFRNVEIITGREKLVLTLSEFFSKNSRPIGDCHSHTERKDTTNKARYPIEPSQEDIDTARENKIYIIVSICQKNKIQTWQKTKKGGIVGTLEKYRFEIRAYWAPENGKIKQVPLICPSAYRLNAFKKIKTT